MDYEFRIKPLEKETAHLREMQELARGRQDVPDDRLGKIESILAAVANRLQETAEAQNQLTVAQAVTEQKLQSLIDLLLH